MSTDHSPRQCPHCGAPAIVNKIAVDKGDGWIHQIDGRWDCTAECYRDDPVGFAESVRRDELKVLPLDTST